MTSARASATRCCCPPDNSRGLRSARASRRTIAKASFTRAEISALRHVPHLEAERNVLGDSHMRKQRVALEDQTHIAPVGRHGGDVVAADDDSSGTRRDQPGDHPQELWSSRSLKARAEPRARLSAPPNQGTLPPARRRSVSSGRRDGGAPCCPSITKEPPRDSCAASSRTPCSPGGCASPSGSRSGG